MGAGFPRTSTDVIRSGRCRALGPSRARVRDREGALPAYSIGAIDSFEPANVNIACRTPLWPADRRYGEKPVASSGSREFAFSARRILAQVIHQAAPASPSVTHCTEASAPSRAYARKDRVCHDPISPYQSQRDPTRWLPASREREGSVYPGTCTRANVCPRRHLFAHHRIGASAGSNRSRSGLVRFIHRNVGNQWTNCRPVIKPQATPSKVRRDLPIVAVNYHKSVTYHLRFLTQLLIDSKLSS